jgi:hypothetical protein
MSGAVPPAVAWGGAAPAGAGPLRNIRIHLKSHDIYTTCCEG